VSEDLSGTGEIRVLTMGHIQDGEVVLPDEGSLEELPEEFILDQNDLLFNRTNSRDLVAKVGIFRGDRSDRVSFASYLVRLTASEDVSPEYLNYLLNSSVVLSKARSMALLSVNQANLNPTKYGQLSVPIPPRAEQEDIVAVLTEESAKLNALIQRIREGIDCVKEFRTALISAVVTGKIDVREEIA
jgi:type I restriction enzyme, S subunit